MKNKIILNDSMNMLLNDFVKYKQSLGYKYVKDALLIKRILFFLSTKNKDNPFEYNYDTVNEFCNLEGSAARTIHAKQSAFRQLAIYLNNVKKIKCYVLRDTLIKCNKDYIPYIYTRDELSKIFTNLKMINFPKNCGKYYNLVINAYIRLLYCCGLRANEGAKLKYEDVDLTNGFLIIRNSKENASRKIPISNSLKDYLIYYQQKIKPIQNIYFFPSVRKNTSICRQKALDYFIEASNLAGIDGKDSNGNVRLHNLRHTFAVHALEKMINLGMDPYCSMPYLSIYMGHKGIESTEIYLRLTSDYFEKLLSLSKDDTLKIFPEVTSNE